MDMIYGLDWRYPRPTNREIGWFIWVGCFAINLDRNAPIFVYCIIVIRMPRDS